MIKIVVPPGELFDERTCEFHTVGKEYVLQLEHSLVSISKWESKWKKPFLSDTPMSDSQFRDYVRCMTITQNIPEDVYSALTKKNILDIKKYMKDSMTATTFTNNKRMSRSSKEVITSEVIYYWMIANGIPKDFEKWHLNRLLTLIEVCNRKNNPQGKMKSKDVAKMQYELNQARRKKYNTKG